MTARLGCDVCGTETKNLPYTSRNYRGLCDECRNLDWKVEIIGVIQDSDVSSSNNDCSNAFVATPQIQTVDSCNGIGNCNGSPGGGSGNSGGGDNGDKHLCSTLQHSK
jgi:hypothetical protein